MFHRGAFSSGVCQGAATQCRRRALGCRGQGVEKQGSGTLKDAPRMCYRKSVSQMQRSICEHGDFLSAEQNGPRGTPPPRLHANPTSPQAMLLAGPLDHTHTHTQFQLGARRHVPATLRLVPIPCSLFSSTPLSQVLAPSRSLEIVTAASGPVCQKRKKKKGKKKKNTHTKAN